MRRPIPFYLAILGLVHFYVGWRLLPDLPIGLGTQIGGALLLVASLCRRRSGFSRARWRPASGATGSRRCACSSSGSSPRSFVFTLLRDVALLFVVLWPGALPLERIITISATAVVALAALGDARRPARTHGGARES